MSQTGEMMPLDTAIGRMMGRWYAGLYGDTQAVAEFVGRGLAKSIKWVPGRMIDDAQAMLQSYQRDQQGEHGSNARLPVVMVAASRDYMPISGDWGSRALPRTMGVFSVAEGAIEGQPPSYYGLRSVQHQVRVQVVVIAAEKHSARSLAAQFDMFVRNAENRHLVVKHTFGQYSSEAPAVIEDPEVVFAVAGESKTMTVLAGDFTIKATTPYYDAPRPGEPNDGSANNPPGYPLVDGVHWDDQTLVRQGFTDELGTTWGDA